MLDTTPSPPAEGDAVIGGGLNLTRTSSSARFAAVRLDGIAVRRCRSPEDWAVVARLRDAAYSRLLRFANTPRPESWIEPLDRSPDTVLLVGYGRSGEALATLRLQDERHGPLELARHVALDGLLPASSRPHAQFARLAALRRPESLDTMFGLFKAAWRWCLITGVETMVIATPPWARPMYEHLCFADLGQAGRFHHPFSPRAEHATMELGVRTAEQRWYTAARTLSPQFFGQPHPMLDFWVERRSADGLGPSPRLRSGI